MITIVISKVTKHERLGSIKHFSFFFLFVLRQHSLVTGKIHQGSPSRHVPKCARQRCE